MRLRRRPKAGLLRRSGSFWVPLGITIGIVAAVTGLAISASTTVTARDADEDTFSITPQQLAPAACAGMGLTAKVVAGNGGAANELIVGNAGANSMNGNGGNDCILGGDGADTLNGGDGDDKIYGDGGNDTLTGGNGTDLCDGGAGTDTLSPPLVHGCESTANIP